MANFDFFGKTVALILGLATFGLLFMIFVAAPILGALIMGFLAVVTFGFGVLGLV